MRPMLRGPRAVGGALAGLAILEAAVTCLDGGRWFPSLALALALVAVVSSTATASVRHLAVGLAISAVGAYLGLAHGLPSQPGVTATLALVLLIAGLARGAAPRAIVVAGLTGVVILVGGRTGRGDAFLMATSSASLLAWAGGIAAGLWQRQLDRQHRAAIDDVRRDERLSLARELHDVAAHHLTGIVLQSQGAQLVGDREPEAVLRAITEVEDAAKDALTAIRDVVGLLRVGQDDPAPSRPPEPLAELVNRFRRHMPTVEARTPERAVEQAWPLSLRRTVSFIVQEALTNVLRHAPEGREVQVLVEDVGAELVIAVTNDRPPMAVGEPTDPGHGLIGMHERVDALGGRLHAGPCGDCAWEVRAVLPIVRHH